MLHKINDDIKQLIVSTIRQAIPEVSVIYLFGSFAKGEALEASDIDLAVLGSDSYDNVKLWNLAQKLSSLCGYDVDLVDLRQATTVMRIQIVAEGEHLFEDGSKESIMFEDFVFSDYARLNEERREILEDIGSRGNVYG